MVKIVEVDEQPDADRDEECYEIDPSEFAKKVNLKETDDVVLVAATGKIKLEVVDPEVLAKTGCAVTGSRTRDSGGVTQDTRHEFAAGDSMDDPYEIDEDEPVLMQMEIVEDRFAVDSSNNSKLIQGYKDERRTAVTPYKIVVKAEPDDLDGVDGFGHDAYSDYNKMNSEPREKDAADVVSDKLSAKPRELVGNNGVQVIPDNSVAKCDPVDSDSVKGTEEHTYDQCLETIPKPRTSDDEDEDGFVIV